MSEAVERRVRMIERVDEYLSEHKTTESTRLLSELRDELVRIPSEPVLRARVAAEIEAVTPWARRSGAFCAGMDRAANIARKESK